MRRLGGVLAASLAILAVTVLPQFGSVASADNGLRWETTATYVFDSPAGVVHATIDIQLRNTLHNEQTGNVIRKPYFTGVSLPVAPDAANLVATGNGAALPVDLQPSEQSDYRLAGIDFARNLFAGQTLHLVVTYDLTGQAPRSDAIERVNPAYASFGAYGVGDPGLTTVRVVIPETYTFDSFGDDAVETVEDGNRVLTAADLDDPNSWYMFVSARNDDALVPTSGTAGDTSFEVRAWPNDPEWAQFAATTISSGLPTLEAQIGLPWPIDHPLQVSETVTPYLYGYAGWFDGDTGDIEVGEDLDQAVMLHELSHAWFNSDLFTDRWVSEGLAQVYSAKAVAAGGGTPEEPTAIDVNAPGAQRLDEWGSVSLSKDDENDASEDYGYNASWVVMKSLADEIGDERMRAVFAAADAGTIAYAGDADAHTTIGATGWHTLLDLAEEVGGSTAWAAELREFVATTSGVSELDARAAARSTYAALATSGAAWTPPVGLRELMASWDFDKATEIMAKATDVLAARDEVAEQASGLGLTPPTGPETAYEEAAGADDGADALETVKATLGEQHAALDAIAAAGDVAEQATAGFAQEGLQSDLDGLLAPARDAFEAGQLDQVASLDETASSTVADWVAAGDLLAATIANAAAPRSFFESVGLRGTDLDGMLDEARAAFSAGDRERATAIAADVQDRLDHAESVGKGRVLGAGGGLLGVLLVAALVVVLVVRRRRRNRRTAAAPSAADDRSPLEGTSHVPAVTATQATATGAAAPPSTEATFRPPPETNSHVPAETGTPDAATGAAAPLSGEATFRSPPVADGHVLAETGTPAEPTAVDPPPPDGAEERSPSATAEVPRTTVAEPGQPPAEPGSVTG